MDDDEAQLEGSRFLLFWDMHGLETAIDIDDSIQSRVEAILKDSSPVPQDISTLIACLTMRATYNIDRNYEMYAIGMPHGTTVEDIFGMFDVNPNKMAALVRSKGIKLLSSSPRSIKIYSKTN